MVSAGLKFGYVCIWFKHIIVAFGVLTGNREKYVGARPCERLRSRSPSRDGDKVENQPTTAMVIIGAVASVIAWVAGTLPSYTIHRACNNVLVCIFHTSCFGRNRLDAIWRCPLVLRTKYVYEYRTFVYVLKALTCTADPIYVKILPLPYYAQ